MLATTHPLTTTGPRSARRRFASCRRAPQRPRSRRASRCAAQKLASGFFAPAPTTRVWQVAAQLTSTHQENSVTVVTTVLGCVVAINKAQAALDAYADHGGEAPDGSHRITADELSRLSSETLAKMDTKAGLSISVFVNDQGGYTVAYRGTEGFNLFGPDWKANEANALGFLSSQYSDAVDFAQAFVRAYGSNVDFSGHSLGGGLAAAAALKTGLTATTFNAAGVGAGTIDAKDLNTKNANGLITNYRNTFDPLTWGQESVIPLLPDALGRQKNVPMASLSTSGHSMDSMMSNLKTDFEKSGCDL